MKYLTYSAIARSVRSHLDQEHRYHHIVRVARCADVLAQKHGIDASKARLAGMLHDLARLYSSSRLVEECMRRDMRISTFERENPIVLHARLGAELAKEDFGVTDPQVLSAIAKHTVADAIMSPLDCVVYLADGLEPSRDYPERHAFWQLALCDLDAAMKAVIGNSLIYLAQKGIPAAPETLDAARTFGVPLGVVPSLN